MDHADTTKLCREICTDKTEMCTWNNALQGMTQTSGRMAAAEGEGPGKAVCFRSAFPEKILISFKSPMTLTGSGFLAFQTVLSLISQ